MSEVAHYSCQRRTQCRRAMDSGYEASVKHPDDRITSRCLQLLFDRRFARRGELVVVCDAQGYTASISMPNVPIAWPHPA